ncbi:zinc finger protein 283-like isoform X2 [Neocloeon triangulifer]|uniref:zinc finger protein 283-like isoform X2 n=1 Tax=Neocloeon triangulifer TaxID=2078957 RepID=UPI00286EFCAF|nr:zinc finger protein 283-like isoform X2 [Neocloeon triangulifer]
MRDRVSEMDLQILCARRVNENSHLQHNPSNEMISSSGSNGTSPLKLPSLVPPSAGMWFQDQTKMREKPPDSTSVSDSAKSAASPQSPPWFPQQQQQPPKDLRDTKANGNTSVWFQPESQDSTNVNVVSTNDSTADDSEEDEDSGTTTNEPVDTTPEPPNHNSAPPASSHEPLPPPATSMMAPWFLAQKAKESMSSMMKPPELNIPSAQHHHPNMSWFLGNKETPNKLHHESNNKTSEHNSGPWSASMYLGQHKINVNTPEHNKDQSSPNKDDEGPWFLGQTKPTEPRDLHKQTNGWFHHTDIKVEQDDTMDKRQEDAVKSGCVWFGHGLLKPDSENTRQDNLSKMMGAWFSSSHMMRPEMVKQEAGTGMHPSGFWFIPGSSASANCNGGPNVTAAHGGGKLYQCDLCQTQFRQRDRLREHRRIHALGETPHTCTICEKAFTTAAARECHAAVAHLNGAGHPPGPCRFCEAGDTQHLEHVGMHNHDGSHHPPLRRQGGGIRRPGGPGGYECKMCGLRFPDGPSLTDHVDHHPGGRPLLCRLCCKTFKSKLGLENHTRLHTGERPFECGECGARFPQRAALDYHVKGRHTGENHRTCGRCGKLFRSTPGYNNHMRLHAVRDTASVNNNAAVVAAAAVAAAGVMAGGGVQAAVNDAVGNILSGTSAAIVASNKEHHPH